MFRLYLTRFRYYLKRLITTWRQEGLISVMRKVNVKLRSKGYRPVLGVEDWEQDTPPRVSIIIPAFNSFSMTRDCVQSIYRAANHEDFEVILVDNASSDRTPKWSRAFQKQHSNFKYFRMKRNIGFGPAVNYGIQNSQSEFVVILNNDTLVADHWLERLLAVMDSDPAIGIVSPVTNYVGEGPQIHPDAANLPPDLDAINAFSDKLSASPGVVYEPCRLVFFCVLIRREVIDLIGYLDEGYEKGNFEDDDYCLRARMAGYVLAIAKHSFVFHHGSVTFKTNYISHSHYMEKNRIRFYSKASRMSIAVRRGGLLERAARKPDVSVILRTKDRPFLLSRALSSLANQTLKDFEVILVNDGGADISDILRSFADRLAIQYVRHESSLGRTAAVNSGFRHSQGGWISYLDDDDVIYPWHLETLFSAARQGNSSFVYGDCNYALFLKMTSSSPNKLVGAPSWDYARNELLVQNYIPIHTWIHARACIDAVGPWNETLDRLEDYEFLIRLSSKYDFKHVKRVVSEYRFYGDSANSIYTDRSKTLNALEEIYKMHPVADQSINEKRRETLDLLILQIQEINAYKDKVDSATPDDLANRHVIRLVTGL
ncbi:MAG: glycosyltransferase family 2 protein [Chloroflexi bacterium]|nr:glycosyltransferase family 2 protein [Chloroflexota bacterium]